MNSIAPPTDAIAAVTHAHPYSWYAGLRRGPALVFDPALRLWIASRADVVRELFANAALRVRPAAEAVPRAVAGTPAGELFGLLVRMNDGAPHDAHKPVLQRALASLDPGAAQAAMRRAAEGTRGMSLCDTVFSLPVGAVARLLGFAERDLPQVVRWTRDFVACLSPLSDAPQLASASLAAAELMDRFEALVDARPAPDGSLVAAVQAEASAPLSRALRANLVGLLSQTCEATAGLLGNSLAALAREPGLRRRIGDRMELLPALVAEVARHDPAVHNTRRFVVEATGVAGQALAPGDALLLVLAAANRDPALNPAPATFELMRAERRCLGFGHGSHGCPGQALALSLAAAGLQALLASGLDTEALLQRGWHYRPSVNVRIPVFH
ncbi:cytochrome P450 [Variovorax saccharolyticus]|uniref:cytochrome P450 n=1 Tax=Variovorax saccharolyticus TaxID=3053516 RepID=UPI00257666EF|nr:cytochrome P450 [Variovorax sp. J31P216]MDM0028642.1 cytochrome P450 [Variovorax sp. J31P216]